MRESAPGACGSSRAHGVSWRDAWRAGPRATVDFGWLPQTEREGVASTQDPHISTSPTAAAPSPPTAAHLYRRTNASCCEAGMPANAAAMALAKATSAGTPAAAWGAPLVAGAPCVGGRIRQASRERGGARRAGGAPRGVWDMHGGANAELWRPSIAAPPSPSHHPPGRASTRPPAGAVRGGEPGARSARKPTTMADASDCRAAATSSTPGRGQQRLRDLEGDDLTWASSCPLFAGRLGSWSIVNNLSRKTRQGSPPW
jgi:hypothetical protein